MNSSQRTCSLIVVAWFMAACAGFGRGEYWDGGSDTDATPPGSTSSTGDAGGSSTTGVETTSITAGSSGGGVSSSYATDVHDLLVAGCERCHSPTGSANTTAFILITAESSASYDNVLNFVDLDEPTASRLLTKSDGMGHGGGAVYDRRSPEYDAIRTWIAQGALP